MAGRAARDLERLVQGADGARQVARVGLAGERVGQLLHEARRCLPDALDRVDGEQELAETQGDTAADENHYSKRAIAAGVLMTALPVRLASGREAAAAYIDARIGEVMRFEAWKAGLPKSDLAATLASLLGGLRYGRPG